MDHKAVFSELDNPGFWQLHINICNTTVLRMDTNFININKVFTAYLSFEVCLECERR